MELQFQTAWKSIDLQVTYEPINDFVVLTGTNGSGKSHLLQAIMQDRTIVDGTPNLNRIKLYEQGNLAPNSGEGQSPSQFRDVWARVKPAVEAAASGFNYPSDRNTIDQQFDQFAQTLAVSLNLPVESLIETQKSAGKVIAKFSDDDYRDFFPMYQSAADLFQFSVTDIFLTYYDRWRENKFQKFLNLHDHEETKWLEDDAFESKYGKRPWLLLDDVLSIMGLPYKFRAPENPPPEQAYRPTLLAQDKDLEVPLGDLSSGERVLLALALGLYAGEHLGRSAIKPRAILLDEADASLHPSMIRSLLKVTREILYEQHGVKIILATHSPTTAALAPEASLYVMSRTSDPRLRKTGRDEALNELTVGLPTLSIRVDHRRQVFVESKYDESYYEKLYQLVRSDLDSPFSLQFLASGSKGAGNRDAVEQVVSNLRTRGNDLVYGLVDRDTTPAAPDHVELSAERYSIENYLLDPLILGAYLLKTDIESAESLSLQPETFYFHVGESNAQSVVDGVSKLLGLGEGPRREIQYFGGFSARVPEHFLETQGHSLEAEVRKRWPQFHQQLPILDEIIDRVLAERCMLIPKSMVDVFSSLVA